MFQCRRLMKEQCVDKNVGPAARCRSEEIRGACVKVLKQRMAFCNFPLAAAERCERVNVDVTTRNMLNVIDSMAEINTYSAVAKVRLRPGTCTTPGTVCCCAENKNFPLFFPWPSQHAAVASRESIDRVQKFNS